LPMMEITNATPMPGSCHSSVRDVRGMPPDRAIRCAGDAAALNATWRRTVKGTDQ